MATRTRAITPDEVFLTPEQQAQEQLRQTELARIEAEAEMSPEDRVMSMLSDLRADERAVVKIYRRGQGNKIFWCDDVPLVDFETGGFPLIRQRFGPGEYEIRVYGSQGVKTKANINIFQSETPQGAQQQQQAAPQNDNLARVLEQMAQNQQAMAEQQRALIESISNRPQVDPMAQMTQMMTLMGAMRQAMAPEPQAKSSITEIVAAIKELKAVSSEINPQAEEKEPSLLQMAPQFLDVLKSGMAAQQQQTQMPQVAIPGSFATMDAVPQELQRMPQVEQPPQTETDDDVNALQKLALMALLSKINALAVSGADPQKAADLILEKAPDEVLDFLATDEWFDVLAQFYPAFVRHKDWLTKARDLVNAELDAPDPATPAG